MTWSAWSHYAILSHGDGFSKESFVTKTRSLSGAVAGDSMSTRHACHAWDIAQMQKQSVVQMQLAAMQPSDCVWVSIRDFAGLADVVNHL
jgi:hypothetical protein